jgi:hypothetical protein
MSRTDDNPEVFKTRLDVYRAQTAPVTEYYRSRGLLNTVDGLRSIDVVTEELTATLARPTGAIIGASFAASEARLLRPEQNATDGYDRNRITSN